MVMMDTPEGVVWDRIDPGKDTSYSIVFSHERIPAELPSSSQYYPMKLSNGSSYLCMIPDTSPTKESLSTSSLEVHSRVSSRTTAILHAALNDWCYHQREEWWSYQLCWNTRIVQFHQEVIMMHGDGNTPLVSSAGNKNFFLLGMSPPAEAVELRYGVDPSGERYIYTMYTNGHICDLTKMPRVTEVRLYCAREDDREKLQVVESEVCRYVASVYSGRACVPELRRQIVQSEIRCYNDDNSAGRE
ncbi:uncharacterized protein TM35_000063420 [Trypanosoma theileri]|uniref:MRH domain-containing protein n=1 Tax=Trypanosoma theileri TaxID=67003 RepID=A0A1X0P339_9TRYP|nr:uncharacterized protein TM35_000063420 [Trypanosoma theileri]ORC91337.1 hypothetical protein TM35_000063420 [Trypanosoma theileri]